ncbi:hypothetical protein BUALT_Bualt16G0035100 [Buddleja alternifolia]|uniref:Uncharacterized protein n=1 Tax=Buddleja alternifolia TaxID=168488 RepID=A0AAV6WFB2_9LAMI|nr:hypothetical protein BUALT_Bualt16G0035100 [Buddleja alternifolia]
MFGLPVELRCGESLMPLHSVTASALLNSKLSSKIGHWTFLSEDTVQLMDLGNGSSWELLQPFTIEAKISILASIGNAFQTVAIGVANTSAMAKSSCGSISNPHGYNDLLAIARSLRMTIGNAYWLKATAFSLCQN